MQRMKNLQKKAEDGRNEKADEERKGKGGGRGKTGGEKRKSLPGWTSCEKGCLCLQFIHSSIISGSLSVWRGKINELFKLC